MDTIYTLVVKTSVFILFVRVAANEALFFHFSKYKQVYLTQVYTSFQSTDIFKEGDRFIQHGSDTPDVNTKTVHSI